MVSHGRKFIFLHIPKTAGTSVRRALGGFVEPLRLRFISDDRKHMSARRVRQLYGADVLERYFSFCFVRNPWERMVSYYAYHRRGQGSSLARSTIEFCRTHGFAEFVAQYVNRDIWQGPQMDWITLDDGSIAVEFVGRVERLQHDFDVVCRRLGLAPRHLGHRNASEHSGYASYYDAATRRLVERAHARDIEAFGYRFGA